MKRFKYLLFPLWIFRAFLNDRVWLSVAGLVCLSLLVLSIKSMFDTDSADHPAARYLIGAFGLIGYIAFGMVHEKMPKKPQKESTSLREILSDE